MIKHPLVTALACCLSLAAAAQARDYNIMAYGAKNDTTVLSTSALQQAIDDCSKACGSRVVVPAGNRQGQ